MSWPPAEVVIDAALVHALLESQFPELASLDCHKIGEGFDNSMWRLGDDLVVRIPRRVIAVANIENELRWLPEVASHVSIATPLPLRAGQPSPLFPWPWLIATWRDGVSGEDVEETVRGDSAVALATFLREIHLPAPNEAPFNPFRSPSLSKRDDTMRSRLEGLDDPATASELLTLWNELRDGPQWSGPRVWIHGDLHPDNTLYRDGRLVGVLDFGDLCAGDPATDLAAGFLSLPYDALPTFFNAYGSVDGDTLRRSAGWALLFGVMLLELGQQDEPKYLRIGELAVTNVQRLAASISSR